MRILFLYSTLTVGGAERQLALLVPALRTRGFEPIVATLRHEGRYFEELGSQGVRMESVAMHSRTDLVGMRRAYRLWRLKPDVVFSQSVDAQVIGHVVALRARARHVTAEHGGPGIPRSFHRRALARLVAPRVHRVVAVSASQLPELAELGYPESRIVVIPNGMPPPEPGRSAEAVRSELGLSGEDVMALFVATLRPEKRTDGFLEAVVRARRQDARLRAVIVGGGPELERIRALAAEAPDAVQVLGERRDVADLITAADLVCLSSSFEGLPMIVLEAMALGRPVLSTQVGGIPEAVVAGRTGWLVPPGDVGAYAAMLVEAAGAPERRRTMGEEARRTYEQRYTLEHMVDRYADLLSGLSPTVPSPAGERAG